MRFGAPNMPQDWPVAHMRVLAAARRQRLTPGADGVKWAAGELGKI